MNQPVRSAALPGLPLRPSVSSSTPTEMLLPRGASAATRTVLGLLKRIEHGTLDLRWPDGSHLRLGSGLEPRATLVTHGQLTTLREGETVSTSAADPLTLVHQQLARCNLQPQPHPHLPFLGGALGLFGYDLGRRFEVLPSRAAADILLPDMAVGIYDWALIVDHQRQQVSLLSYNDPQERLAWLEPLRQPI